MKKTMICAAFAAAAFAPSAALAQAIPPAVIAVVDLEKVTSECNACKTAAAALRSQATAQENREKALGTPLETEQKAIQTAIDALAGKPADAALENRVKAFQTRAQQAQQEAMRGRQQLQANQAHIQKQISDRLGPIYTQVMQRRGANMLVEIGTTLASGQALDVTNDVLAALNAALPSIQTTAPAQRPAQPQGR
ncbi:MAG TPA: OmpH family outer membrane protein [Sphingomicrobium sp.]|nr:OmpH family outer membrane protein [Sphingomicrobium sp.]